MTAFAPWTGPRFKSDEPSRVEQRRERKRITDAEWRACCKAVDARDRGRCRVCNRRGNPESVSLLDRLHRHHMVMRSKGRDDDPSNVISVCSDCHSLLHKHVLDIRGDANEGIEIWRLEKDRGWFMERRETVRGVERD